MSATRGDIASGFRKDPDGVFRCRAFEQFPWLEHGFTSRQSDAAGVADGLITLRQTHSDVVVDAAGLVNRAREGDALISAEAGRRIGVRSADCVPLLLADPVTRVVAAVHAGWRGTVAEIAAKTVARMVDRFAVRASDLHVAVGPAIRVCCYQVGPEVAARFAPWFPEWGPDEAGQAPGRKIDLIEANRRVLVAAGVPREQIYDSGLCTFCRPDEFVSYRREPQSGWRSIAYITRMA